MNEGVVQFTFRLESASPPTERAAVELTRWRAKLFERDAIGCDLSRYGACYGNVSVRTGPWAAPPGRREFLVSGTQTGGIAGAGPSTLCRVLAYDHERNRVIAQGPVPPSSETMTHGAIYDAALDIRCVVHGHDPVLWRWILDQAGPHTPPDVAYGTPEMAAAARRVVRSPQVRSWRCPSVLAMAGHEDGVIAWGASPKQATQRFLAAWDASRDGEQR
ncbi:MAG: ribulose-5-phosphate 4-epimerase/fuculose-1-phosphate aldolase [Myxococcota bacterium]|jgi:ribulose-5-phosphate 4-epimerase/fuculose-1-phosphate aldolase